MVLGKSRNLTLWNEYSKVSLKIRYKIYSSSMSSILGSEGDSSAFWKWKKFSFFIRICR